MSVTEKILKQFRREKVGQSELVRLHQAETQAQSAIVEIDACKSLRCVKLFDEWATTELEEGMPAACL